MKTLYLVRHGESQANAEGVVAGGALDSPLTELGIAQAHKAALQVRELDFDVFISSTMVRAVDTAEIIATEIGWTGQIEKDDRLIELDAGEATGTSIHEYHERLRQGEVIHQAETLQQMRDRLQDFLTDITKRPENSFLVVSHNGTGKMIRGIVDGDTPTAFLTVPDQRNGEVLRLELHETS